MELLNRIQALEKQSNEKKSINTEYHLNDRQAAFMASLNSSQNSNHGRLNELDTAHAFMNRSLFSLSKDLDKLISRQDALGDNAAPDLARELTPMVFLLVNMTRQLEARLTFLDASNNNLGQNLEKVTWVLATLLFFVFMMLVLVLLLFCSNKQKGGLSSKMD